MGNDGDGDSGVDAPERIYKEGMMLPELEVDEEYRSSQCCKDGLVYHKSCRERDCECPCHDDE